MKKPIRAAIYCRVATSDQLSLDRQEQLVCDYAKAKGYKIFSITKEMFKGSTMNRPGIQSVLTDTEKGAVDIVLVYGISRIGRNTVETMRFIRKLKEHGIAVESVKEGILLDTLLGVAR